MHAIDEVFRKEHGISGRWQLKEAVVGRGQEIRLKIIAEYFDQAKWIFAMDREIYQNYIN